MYRSLMRKKKTATGSERTPEDPENVAARQRRYKLRRQKRGETRVVVWVPSGRSNELKALAATWSKEAKAQERSKTREKIASKKRKDKR